MEEERIQKAYAGVIDYFRGQIMAGELKAGERIPPEREIAALLGVSRNSVREAIRIMDMMGIISSVQGSGNYITCDAGDGQAGFPSDRPGAQFPGDSGVFSCCLPGHGRGDSPDGGLRPEDG